MPVFSSRADDQLAVLIQDGSLDVQLANVLSLGVEVGIVAVEPIDAAMRFQVGRVQDTPDGGARHRFVGVAVDQLGREIVEAPLTGDAIMLAGFAGGQRDDFELFVGGKSSAADRNAEHLADQRDRAGDKRVRHRIDGVASATELVGNLQIGRLIRGCQPQDQPTTKDQGLRRGMGSGQSLQPILCFEVQDNRRSKGVWHDRTSLPDGDPEAICQLDVNAPICPGQLQLRSDL